MTESELHTPARVKARIEIIPLIDVVFFLLATFVLFTLSLEKIGAILIPFPEARRAIDISDDQTLHLQATDHGLVAWREGQTAVPEYLASDELAPRLADYRRRAKQARVLVSGDGTARFGGTVKLLDAVRLARITEVTMETAP